MDLKQLKAFIAIAELRSFSAAAKVTGISQPSLSRLLKQLETDMNVALVDRYHRPLQLTTAGLFFYDKIDALLTELDAITHMTQRLSAPSKGLNIGFVPSVLYGLLPEVIATFKQQNADTEVNLKDISSYQQIEALKSGEIDVGFGRFAHQDPWIQQILLRHERYLVALPKAHPLADVKEQRLLDLANSRLILYHQTHLPGLINTDSIAADMSTSTQDKRTKQTLKPEAASVTDSVTEPLLYLFAQHGITPLRTSKVSDLQVALGLVAAGEGITLVPASLQVMRTKQISYQRLIHENVTSPIYLHTLKDFIHPKVNDLLTAIYEIYEQRGITYRRQQFV
ncbi:LysR family transcriptional regulator [uncultured Psychrobacter sp.]|uniref:LysR family transcriptional regulator n=1 Tax=uncultured Psychrobacter sp. TaxID=259303 RepID=UPI0030D97383